MKLTKDRLKQIIKEELEEMMTDSDMLKKGMAPPTPGSQASISRKQEILKNFPLLDSSQLQQGKVYTVDDSDLRLKAKVEATGNVFQSRYVRGPEQKEAGFVVKTAQQPDKIMSSLMTSGGKTVETAFDKIELGLEKAHKDRVKEFRYSIPTESSSPAAPVQERKKS